MDPGGKNQTLSREDIDVMRNQLNQLMEAMISLANREDNIQRITVNENVTPPQVNYQAQPQPIQIPIENPFIQEHTLSKMDIPHLMMQLSIIVLHSHRQMPKGQSW